MAGSTNFPTSLDTDTELYDVTDDVTDVIAAHHNNVKELLKAIQAKIGIDSSAVTTSVDYHLSNSATFVQTDTDAGDTTTSTTYEDIDGLSMTVEVTKTSTVWLVLTIQAKINQYNTKTYAIIYWDDGTESTSEIEWQLGGDHGEYRPGASQVVKTGVTAGSYTAKGQFKVDDSHGGAVQNGVLTAFVIPESL